MRNTIFTKYGAQASWLARAAACAAVTFVIAMPTAPATMAQQGQEDRKTRKTPALREKVYETLTEAQELGEAEQFGEAIRVLDKLSQKDDLNSYEKAQMYNFYAFIYFQQERFQDAIRSYENVRAQPDLPEAMETQAIYALGQLYFTVENYPKAIELLETWFRSATNPGAGPYVFLSQAYYQQKQYRKAIGPLDKAMDIARSKGQEVKENWLLLKRVYHYELKEYQVVADVLNQLIARFPKREYWNQLSAVYGELGDNKRQLAVLELANMQGYLDRSQDLRNLAQLFMLNGDPLRGAQTLEKSMNDGIVETNLANLKLLAQAWNAAREDEKALPVLQRAAQMSNDGKLDLRIAYSYINVDKHDEAAAAAREAIRKGGLRNTGEAYILMGTALFNADKLNEAKDAFRNASGGSNGKRAAQWLTHISKEEQRRAILAETKALGREADAAARKAREAQGS
ncbi:MAG: tetratricopeptide repeat protein [Gammaproteobacteria bacterium]